MKAHDIDRILYYLQKVFVGQSEADDLFRIIEVLKDERNKQGKRDAKKQSA
jgi:hypothetical protein